MVLDCFVTLAILDAPRNGKHDNSAFDLLLRSASCVLRSEFTGLTIPLDILTDLTILCSIQKIQAKVRGVRSAV